ncbi:MAG TPA: HD-GYP domain-containing protein [Gaiellaceae bacterium]|nr:HD-GYP domain-containing protein [Gaiellaceae bacterium]
MRLNERLLPVLALGAAGAGAPAVLEWLVGSHRIAVDGRVHFFAVGFTALAAAAACVALSLFGARFGDRRTVLVGGAFGVMAALLALHGLSTPGFIIPEMNGVIVFTGGATLPAGAALLALSSLGTPQRLRLGVKQLLAVEAVLLAGVLALGISAILSPDLLPYAPAASSPEAIATLAVGLLLFLLLGVRALRTFLLTRRTGDLLVAIGIAWLSTSLVAALTLSYTQLGWWLGHGFELDGILAVAVPVALDLARTVQSRPLAGDLQASDLVLAEETFLGSHVRALTLSLAQRDDYTEQHTRRVALRAVQVGELLGLSRSSLRTLATGGLVHDIGKLSIPDSILKKPGPLDDDEYEAIKRHTELGAKLLDELGGFSPGVRRLVLDHHERLDGRGYPRGLGADEIDLETRILTACDVYDALISARVYRPAWSHEEAMALLRREAGTAFDPRCVDALERVLARERGAREPRPELVLRPAVAAAGA